MSSTSCNRKMVKSMVCVFGCVCLGGVTFKREWMKPVAPFCMLSMMWCGMMGCKMVTESIWDASKLFKKIYLNKKIKKFDASYVKNKKKGGN